MRFKQVGNKADSVLMVIRNAETSATIPIGSPVTLVLNGTNDGLDVVLPNTAADAKNGAFKYGIATSSILAGAYGESLVFGFTSYALMTRMTRAATTDSWTSSQSVQSGIALGWESINNALVMNASMVGSLGTLQANCVLASSLASSAASASATTDTRTAITNAVRVFVRMM
jgi:hypothetical protein